MLPTMNRNIRDIITVNEECIEFLPTAGIAGCLYCNLNVEGIQLVYNQATGDIFATQGYRVIGSYSVEPCQ